MHSAWRALVAGCVLVTAVSPHWPAAAMDVQKTFPLSILGVAVKIPVALSFQANTEDGTLAVQLSAVSDLKEMQDRALEIARKLPVPTGNCDRKGVNVVINSIDDAEITPDGQAAVIELAGHVTVWGCADLFGNDVKTIVVSDNVRVVAAVELVVVGGKEIHLKLSRPAEFMTGNALTADAARMFLGDLNAKLSSALSGIFDAHEARATLPELPGADLTIAQAAFAAKGSVLTLQASGSGRLKSEAFNRALEFLTK
jgi:hypothetical protein